jgi:hypothetical protein
MKSDAYDTRLYELIDGKVLNEYRELVIRLRVATARIRYDKFEPMQLNEV